MSNRLIYTNVFIKELENICEYIAEDNLAAAEKFAGDVFDKTGKLSDFPLSGILPKEKYRQLKNYRLLVLGNYIVYYQFDSQNKNIYLHRIVHGARYAF